MFAKTFRNTLVASSLLVGASLLAGPAALAQDVSGPTPVNGSVSAQNTVVFRGATGATISDGSFTMGELDVHNNASAGWTLAVSSANGGKLVNGTNSITYTNLTTTNIGSSVATAVTPTIATPSGTLHDSAFDAAVAAGVTADVVTATISGSQSVPAGTYADSLTFTLTSKP